MSKPRNVTPQQMNPRELIEEASRLRSLALSYETQGVRAALSAVGGNVRQAADVLSMPHTTLARLLSSGGRLHALYKETQRKAGRPRSTENGA